MLQTKMCVCQLASSTPKIKHLLKRTSFGVLKHHKPNPIMITILAATVFLVDQSTAQCQESMNLSFITKIHSALGFTYVNWLLAPQQDCQFPDLLTEMKDPVLFLPVIYGPDNYTVTYNSESTLTFVFPGLYPSTFSGPFVAPVSWRKSQYTDQNLKLTSSGKVAL